MSRRGNRLQLPEFEPYTNFQMSGSGKRHHTAQGRSSGVQSSSSGGVFDALKKMRDAKQKAPLFGSDDEQDKVTNPSSKPKSKKAKVPGKYLFLAKFWNSCNSRFF